MTKKRLSRKSKQLLKELKKGAVEVHDNDAWQYRELEDAGLISWGEYQGEQKHWRRVTVR